MSSVERIPVILSDTTDGKQVSLEVQANWQILQVKQVIKEKAGIDTTNITLSFGGKVLMDKDILSLVGIKQGSKIAMSIQVKGGLGERIGQHY